MGFQAWATGLTVKGGRGTDAATSPAMRVPLTKRMVRGTALVARTSERWSRNLDTVRYWEERVRTPGLKGDNSQWGPDELEPWPLGPGEGSFTVDRTDSGGSTAPAPRAGAACPLGVLPFRRFGRLDRPRPPRVHTTFVAP